MHDYQRETAAGPGPQRLTSPRPGEPTAPPLGAPAVAAPRWARRRLRAALAAGLLLASSALAVEGWAAWEERSARAALAEERLDDARDHVGRALRVRRGRESTNVLAARVARLRGAYSEAEQYLARCGGRDGMSEPVQLEWLLLRCQRGDVDELAPGLLGLAEGGHAESPAICEALAAVYMRQARYQKALHCLDRWVEGDPGCARALDWRGWVSNQLDHRAQAVGDYQRALELRPGRSAVRLRLAEILVDSSRHAEALPHLERLRQERPDDSAVLVALARCRVVQSRTEEARALLDAVLATHPDDYAALLQRGKLELETGRFAEAERWLRQALERAPRGSDARYSLSLSLKGQGGRRPEADQELARWRQERQTLDRLTRLLRTELDDRPNDPDLAREAGELLLRLGEDRRGVFWLHRALALSPRHVPALRALAAYYERSNDPEKAAEYRRQLAALGAEK